MPYERVLLKEKMDKNTNLKDLNINKEWSLFLDRDGVINIRFIDDYIKKVEEFEFMPGVPEAVSKFSRIFGRIFIITNQRGIARNLMTEKDLQNIHDYMLNEFGKAGGRIDKIYFCPHDRDEDCNCRKPRIGMALKAFIEFPDVNFDKSIMVGDTVSDMEFGKNAGMLNILVSPEPGEYFTVNSLQELANKF